MGCFLGCFGYSTKHKRRKPAKKLFQGRQGLGSYEPLQSSFSMKLDVADKPITSYSDFSDRPEEGSGSRIRKKVSFNLNVTTYEPIPKDSFSGSDEERVLAKSKEETEKEISSQEGESVAPSMGSLPTNHRYYNCEDSYDDESDHQEYEEDDLDYDDESDGDEDKGEHEDDDDQDDGGSNLDDIKTRNEFNEEFFSVPKDKMASNLVPQNASEDQQPKRTLVLNQNAPEKSRNVCSVLTPVENLTQWKEIKEKSKPPYQRKENTVMKQSTQAPFSCKANKPLLFDSPVYVSLSNWLISSENMPKKSEGIIS